MQIEISRETVVKSTFRLDLSVVDIKELSDAIVSYGCEALPPNGIQTIDELIAFLSSTEHLFEVFNALQNRSQAGICQISDEFSNEEYYFHADPTQ